MPLSFPSLYSVEVDGEKRWQATCRTCGHDMCETPQLTRAAVEDMRRAHGVEAACARPRREPV